MFTGFKAYCLIKKEGEKDKEIVITEQNNFFDETLKRTCATNWHQVDKENLKTLELWWHDERKAIVEDKPKEFEWVFFHTGSMASSDPGPVIISRTVGYKKPSKAPHAGEDIHYFTVDEITGEFTYSETIYIPNPAAHK
jgi:hypothetical protein